MRGVSPECNPGTILISKRAVLLVPPHYSAYEGATQIIRAFISRTSSRRRTAVLASAGVAAAAGALAVVGTASAAAHPAARTSSSCSKATLKGAYIFYNDGWLVAGGKSKPFSIAGIDHFNGAGTGHGVSTFDVNGKVVNANSPNASTYTIKADCIGKIVYDTAGSIGHFNMYVSPSGHFFSLVETDPGSVGGGLEYRAAR